MRLWVKWRTRNEATISRIKERFALPDYVTLNGLTPADISSEEMPLLEETAKRGYIAIIHEGWKKNGDAFSLITR